MLDRRKGVRLRSLAGRDTAVLRIGLREVEVSSVVAELVT